MELGGVGRDEEERSEFALIFYAHRRFCRRRRANLALLASELFLAPRSKVAPGSKIWNPNAQRKGALNEGIYPIEKRSCI
jgi:hypothetical protein